ncbi:MAG: DNA translocase FtsK 4TM domain-containing protein [Alphaproteobacteria bacterium]
MNLIPESFNKFFKNLGVTLFGIVMCLIGTLGTISIISYSQSDISINTATNVQKGWFDVFGSYYADLMLQFFGLAGIFITFSIIAWGYKLAKFKVLYNFKMRFISLILFIIMLSTGLSSLDAMLTKTTTVQGIIGHFIGNLTILNFPNQSLFIGILLIFFSIPFLMYAVAIERNEWNEGFKKSQKGISLFFAFNKKVYDFTNNKIKRRPSEELLDLPEEALPQDNVGNDAMDELFAPPKKVAPLKTKANKRKATKPKTSGFELPGTDLLVQGETSKQKIDPEEQQTASRQLERILEEFGVKGEIVGVRHGPVVTTFELEPAPGVRSSRVINLTDDIARTMGAKSVRIASIPGKTVIGIEMPNVNRETVNYKQLIDSKEFKSNDMKLPLVLGKSIEGQATLADLATMPHLLIAGTTGSGKSVGLNGMILSLLFKYTPDELKMIMVDPKMLEFAMYEDIPHLISPVVTDPKKAIVALKWAVQEMNQRYASMAKMGVRNIEGYNQKVETILKTGEVITETIQTGFDENGHPIFEERQRDIKKYPYLVIIVDEMADLMLVAGKEIEGSIQSLAQKARAAGIHLIMATQRPSVDVITGIIKANFPTRISYMVTSKIDSRTIINEGGAEQLLGRGDMLYLAGGLKPTRHHAPFVQDQEVQDVCDWLRAQSKPDYIDAVTEDAELVQEVEISASGGNVGKSNSDDEMYDEAIALVAKTRKASTSYIQRSLKIGYNRAANIIERMEEEGIVSAANRVGKREILIPEKEY